MDDVERLIRTFRGQGGQSASAWKLDVLLDLGEQRDPRIVPFLLSVLADHEEAVEVRLEVLNRLRRGLLNRVERPRVAREILHTLTESSEPRLRLEAALALGDFADIGDVVRALGAVALLETESFDLRYAAFASIERAGPSPECVALLRQLSADELLGRSAASMLQVWRVQ